MIGSQISLVHCRGEFCQSTHLYSSNRSDAVPSRHFVTASYDGHVHIFDYSQNAVFASSVHDAPVTSLSLDPTSISGDKSLMIATASHDLTGRLVRVSLNSDTENRTSSTLASLHLHTSPLSSVAYSPSGDHLLTASWDALIGLWESRIPDEDEVDVVEVQADRRKRRRVGGRESEQRPKRKAPSSVLKSHTARVSKAVFSGTGKVAFSCGFDSTVKSWDVENSVCTSTIVGPVCFFDTRNDSFHLIVPFRVLFRLHPRNQCLVWWYCRTIILWCHPRQTALSQSTTSEPLQPPYLQPRSRLCTRPCPRQLRSLRHRIPRLSRARTTEWQGSGISGAPRALSRVSKCGTEKRRFCP